MVKTIDDLRNTDILDLAQSLGMSLKKITSHEYMWEDHDSFKIFPYKNRFSWFSRDIHGDVFSLVQLVQEEKTGKKLTFLEAKNYLETGEFKEFEEKEAPKEPFSYYLNAYEDNTMEFARDYLKNTRGLSDNTIDFFVSHNVLTQANHKSGDMIEPVIVFKTFNDQGKITGASLQGIEVHPDIHERGRLKRLMRGSDGFSGMHVDIGNPNRLVVAESPIDLMSYFELHRDSLDNVRLLAMDGLKEATIGRHLAEIEAIKANRPIIWSTQVLAHSITDAVKKGYFDRKENEGNIILAVDNDEAGQKFMKKLRDRGVSFLADIPEIAEGEKKADWNDILKRQKEIDKVNEDTKKVPELTQEQEIGRTNISGGSLQDKPVGSAEPVSKDTFEQTVTSHPTLSYPFLKFSTDNAFVSNVRGGYHVASEANLRSLNYYAPIIQETAQWYLNTVANSEVTYFYKNGNNVEAMRVDYGKDKFIHLTGIRPTGRGLTAEDVLEQFAKGQGHFDNILVSRSFVDKVQVLPLFQEIVQSKSFVFDDIKDIKKMKSIKADTAIRTENKQLLVAFRTIGDVSFPVSLLKPSHLTNINLESKQEENAILGVFKKTDGKVERLSINKDYIYDEGEELLSLLQNNELEPIIENERTEVFSQEVSQADIGNTDEKVSDLIKRNDTRALSKHLKEGVKNYLNSEKYKQFLTVMSKFHQYSPRNIQFLIAQNPNVSHVASFKGWKDNFDRNVKKGEKSLRIFAPLTIKERDPKTGKVLLDKEGKEKTKTIFKLVPVFDVEQTEGKELPRPVQELQGNHDKYASIYRATKSFAEEQGVTLSFDKNLTTSNGYFSPKQHAIVIKSGMSEQQTLKTIFHELAHMHLKHEKGNIDISHAELQAESVAYVVASHFGFDTSEYSFGYLASWSPDKETLEQLENQLVIVQKEAKELIRKLDDSLERTLGKSQDNELVSKLNHLKEVNLEKSKEKEKEENSSKKLETDKEK